MAVIRAACCRLSLVTVCCDRDMPALRASWRVPLCKLGLVFG